MNFGSVSDWISTLIALLALTGFIAVEYSRLRGKDKETSRRIVELEAKSLSKNKLVNSGLVEWCSSIQETICADVN